MTAQAPGHARLAFLTGSKAGQRVMLDATPSTVGRSPGQTIRFSPDEVIVSGAHATIEPDGDGWMVRDLDSRNGTYVNRRRVTEHRLQPGDVIEFGTGGPSAQFLLGSEHEMRPTLDLVSTKAPTALYDAARARADRTADDGGGALQRGFSTTREFMALAYERTSRRARRTTVAVVIATAAGIGAVAVWQQRQRGQLEDALARFAIELESERGSRALLEENLAGVQVRYDSLLREVESSRQQLEQSQQAAQASTRFVANVTRQYSGGVALIVFSYGYVARGTTRLLRFELDDRGRPASRRAPDGRIVPRFTFGGSGPPLSQEGTATGFLVDSTGLMLTNRHVAEPWLFEDDLDRLTSIGLDVEPLFLSMRAYFPPGDQSYPLSVIRTSETVDVALVRTMDPPTGIPTLPLADRAERVPPGEQLVFIGYPTGVHNLMFRVSREERSQILQATGEEQAALAEELARRHLIQPLVISGSVSDTTGTEIIHTATATGGGSGGPLLGPDQRVIGIHYAAVRSPIAGDPFQTQRAVTVRFIWEVLEER